MSVPDLLILHALVGIPLGLAAGALLGPVARRTDGWGGYGSFRRRALRLGHVSLVMLPLLSGFYGLCADNLGTVPRLAQVGAPLWVAASLALSAALGLAAWRERLASRLLPLPAAATIAGAILLAAAILGAHGGPR